MEEKKDLSLGEIERNITSAYGRSVIWAILMMSAIGALIAVFAAASIPLVQPLSVTPYWFEKGLTLIKDAHPGMYALLSRSVILMLFMKLIFAPVVEEAAFRYFPITMVKNMERSQIRATIIVVGGIVFGILHGHVLNILIQGVVGVILGYLYLRNYRSDLTSYLSCVAVHMMYNFTVLMAQMLA
jgi:membrane protease YdiL (CAAX protease family)